VVAVPASFAIRSKALSLPWLSSHWNPNAFPMPIRIYNADGTVASNAFATGMAGLDTYLAFGQGAGGFDV
jgi:hypothetical protein